jgi:hypothetical protein
VQQRLAGGEAAHILFEQRLPSIRRALDAARNVRRDEDVASRPERMIGRQRLLFEDVERGAAEVPGGEERVGVEGFAAADVDDERTRPQRAARSRRRDFVCAE